MWVNVPYIHGSYGVGIPNLWRKKWGVFVGLVGILDGYDIMCYWGMICWPPNDIFCMYIYIYKYTPYVYLNILY